ncbi:hypothetical protein PG988_008561 [Apiospora saccharicola]
MASDPTTPKAVYVSVSVEPCNSEETRKYWAERAARAKAGLANPSALVNRASGEFDQGLVNAILAGKGELIATTVDGVRQDNSMSTTDIDGTVVHHDVSGLHPSSSDNGKGTEPFPPLQSVSSGSVLRSSDPFVDKHTANTRASSEQSSHRRQETARYHVPMDNNVGPTQPPASTPTASSPDEDDIFVGGEPGPDVGYRYRADSRVSQPSTPTTTAPEDCHDNNNVHPGASRSSFSVCTVSRSCSRPTSRSRSRRPSAVHQKRSVSSLRSKFSSRKLSAASSDGQDQEERPIVVTNALHHILYDGPCGHCETNHCACQKPDSPGLPPVDAPSNSRARITTEGFCRHCVLNRCTCVVQDPRWGLHHATDTLRRTQQHQLLLQQSSTDQGGASSEQQSLRIISDTGTVRHYATGPDDSPNSNSSSGREDQVTTTATIANTNAAAPRAPTPAYRARFSLAHSGGNDQMNDSNNNVHSPAVDIEAQEQQGQPRRRFRLWRIRCHPRSHSRTRSDVRPAPHDERHDEAVLRMPSRHAGSCPHHHRGLVLYESQQPRGGDGAAKPYRTILATCKFVRVFSSGTWHTRDALRLEGAHPHGAAAGLGS